ncbi:MAG TPA: mandelate racemase/muconate lactonizing enzyme family protein [Pirellulaceae bacterium]|jgi:L-alanine-DL-glutamate epimerase-like enolase superfamily enzyme|nr:mandelate racemase/muconate lactonizing enzyme family protein [Pirellulaceae bacterium]
MRIRRIRILHPENASRTPAWKRSKGHVVVGLWTDEGHIALGEGGGGEKGINFLVEEIFPDLLRREFADIDAGFARVGELQKQHREPHQIMALSALDLALWDLRGKTLGQPVARLLDPKVDLSVPLPVYRVAASRDDALVALDAGFAGVKVRQIEADRQPRPEKITRLFSQVREVVGPDYPLMLDAFGYWTVEQAMDVALASSDLRPYWLEEPFPNYDFDSYRRLVNVCPIPIAGGEHETSVEQFDKIIDERIHSILQPDVSWCGGMTALQALYAKASDRYLRVCPHRGGEPYALHAIAAFDGMPLVDEPRYWTDCYGDAPQPQNGVLRLSDAPGFGISVPEERWEREFVA